MVGQGSPGGETVTLTSRKLAATAVVFVFAALCGCTTVPINVTYPDLSGCCTSSWVQTMLFFGSAKGAGGTVTAEEWQQFVASEVTPAFPGGFTVMDARGQWLKEGQVTKEEAKVLVLVHGKDDGSDEKTDRLRSAYKTRFGQESVLKVSTPACVEF